MSDLLINVRQIGNYPQRTASDGGELVLVQPNGVGSAYQTLRADTLMATALSGASRALGVGVWAPGDAYGANVFSDEVVLPDNGALLFNAYLATGNQERSWRAGPAAAFDWNRAGGFSWATAPAGPAGGLLPAWVEQMQLRPDGSLWLSAGTLTVARDPGSAMEVATMRWVGANTVASFMGRRGQVQLFSDDVYRALGLEQDSLATAGSVQWAIAETLRTHPFVWSWNGRCGNVWLTEEDTNAVMTATGAAPLASLAPPGDSSARIANTAWVSRLVYGKFWAELSHTFAPLASPVFIGKPMAPEPPLSSNDGSLATTEWVRNMISALAAGVVSWNGRTGFVALELADIEAVFTAAGAVPLVNTPAVTASGGEIVNAAWTNAAIQASRDTSVLSFNTRVGDIVLSLADVRAAEGQRRLFIGLDPPATPLATDLWMDSTDPTGGVLYVWYVDGTPGQWVALSGGAAGPMGAQGNAGPPGPALRPKGTVPSVVLLPTTGNQAGDLWFVTATNESFAWDDSGAGQWVSLGVIGQAFPDAPSDGGVYARQNGIWIRIANDGVY